MIEIKNLSKSFGSFKAVDDISINVKKATIHGIIGENGAGKTTLIKCLVGIYKPDKGQILIEGQPVYENPQVKVNIGYVADSNTYFTNYSVNTMADFFGKVYPNFSKKKFDELNTVFNIDQNRMIGRLSKGQQMRLAFMLNIASSPKVLVLDEPTSGLDAISKNQLLEILVNEVEEREMTVVISSHHLSELEKICDGITMINGGKLQYQSSIDDIKERIKKFQAVFKTEPDIKELKKHFYVQKFGSVYYLTTDSYDLNTIPMLKEMGAYVAEEIGMTLEEIFIFTHRKESDKYV